MHTPVSEESRLVMWRNLLKATQAHQPAGPASPCWAHLGHVGPHDLNRKGSLRPLQTQVWLEGENAIQVLEDPWPVVSCRVKLASHVTHLQCCRERMGGWGEGADPCTSAFCHPVSGASGAFTFPSSPDNGS